MDAKRTIAVVAAAVALALLLGTITAQHLENRRMRAVLIDHTMQRLQAEFDQARTAEERELTMVRAELRNLLVELSTAQGLNSDASQGIQRGLDLVDRMMALTESGGLAYE